MKFVLDYDRLIFLNAEALAEGGIKAGCSHGASGGHGEENQTGGQMMRFLINVGTDGEGICCAGARFSDRHVGRDVDAAKRAASEAIRINLEAHREAGQQIPEPQSVSNHRDNPEFQDLLFAYVEVGEPHGRIAA